MVRDRLLLLTSKQLRLEVHRIERVGSLIIVGFDLTCGYKFTSVFDSRWRDGGVERLMAKLAQDCPEGFEKEVTFGDLLQTLVGSHDCKSVLETRSQAGLGDLVGVRIIVGGVEGLRVQVAGSQESRSVTVWERVTGKALKV